MRSELVSRGSRALGPQATATATRGTISHPLRAPQGHTLSYLGLWLFTALLIFQPADLFPGVTIFTRLTFFVAALTLLVFVVSQLHLERRLSTWTREIGLLLAFCAAAVVSLAWSVDTGNSIATLLDSFAKAVLMFFVMINVVRTEKRLLGLLCLAIAAGAFLSWGAVNAFRHGQFAVEGYRVRGSLTGALLDPNDSALFLVMMLPITLALLISSRQRLGQLLYALAFALMLGAIFVTYSRGGFLALACAGTFLLWKMFHRWPGRTALALVLGLLVGASLLPPNYADRLGSILDPTLDPHATTVARKNLLDRSLEVAASHPLTGVGMGNFPLFSIRGQVSHNAYTQVASEMGYPAMLLYLAFIVWPFQPLRRMERETSGLSHTHAGYRRLHLLAIAMQASLVGFVVGSFFLSVAYYWFIYYLVGYTVCLRRLYETGLGRIVGTYEMGATEMNTFED